LQPATNKLVLGTVQFGLNYGINNTIGKPNKETVAAILDLAYKNNIHLLDTAEAYGDSQEVIGNYHNASPNKFQVITKYSAAQKSLPENITNRVKADIRTLKVNSLYCYMFHSFADYKKHFNDFKKELLALKKEGIIERIGVSIYTNGELEELLTHEDIDVVQLPFNLLDNVNQRGNIIAKAKQKGIEIHTRSAFLQGLFFKNTNELPVNLLPLKENLEEINAISNECKFSINDLALSYVLYQNQIDRVLIGVETVEQMQKNILSSEKKLSPEVAKKIDSISVNNVNLLNPSTWSN